MNNLIYVIDFGGKDSTYVARTVRKLGVYSEIHHDLTKEQIDTTNVKGIIFNRSRNFENFPQGLINLTVPTLTLWPENYENWDSDIKTFITEKCDVSTDWNIKNFINMQIEQIQKQVGNSKVLLALSGGVDSSVVAALLAKAIGSQLVCVHVNHGLLRKGEPEQVVATFGEKMNVNLIYVDAVDRFLNKLRDVCDPEEKRKIIGAEFIRVFEEEAAKLAGIEFLAQGTIYPDIIESGTKTSGVIKSHHNVGGLPSDLQFALVEPLKQLFKDEVRECGVELGLSTDMVYRQPFPGPGLGVRCLGAITAERLELVRESDAILHEEFKSSGLSETVWQYFTIVPDFKSVGIRDDHRSYEYPVIIRAVNTIDAMVADIEHIDWEILDKISNRILKEVNGVNRVCYDLTQKPPGTIEWE